MYIKRTLILSKLGVEDKKALATIQKSDERPCITFRFQENYNKLFALVRYGNSPIELVPLQCNDNCFYGNLPNFFDCTGELYVAIVIINGGKAIPIYMGGSNHLKHNFYNQILQDLPFYYSKCQSIMDIENDCCEKESFSNKNENKIECKDAQKYENLFESATEDEVNEIIANSLISECLNKKDKCENCVYKEAFYKQKNNDKCAIKNVDSNCNEFVDNDKNTDNKSSGKSENFENVNLGLDAKNVEKTGSYSQNEHLLENDIVLEDNQDKNDMEYTLNDFQNKSTSDEIDCDLKFYKQIEKSLKSLFEYYPRDEILQDAIQDSEFVKIDYEDTGDYYSVGYICEEGVIKYICYAIPCSAGSPPPKNMEEFSQYLQIDNEKGYYLMYQSASSGETIKVSNVV